MNNEGTNMTNTTKTKLIFTKGYGRVILTLDPSNPDEADMVELGVEATEAEFMTMFEGKAPEGWTLEA